MSVKTDGLEGFGVISSVRSGFSIGPASRFRLGTV